MTALIASGLALYTVGGYMACHGWRCGFTIWAAGCWMMGYGLFG